MAIPVCNNADNDRRVLMLGQDKTGQLSLLEFEKILPHIFGGIFSLWNCPYGCKVHCAWWKRVMHGKCTCFEKFPNMFGVSQNTFHKRVSALLTNFNKWQIKDKSKFFESLQLWRGILYQFSREDNIQSIIAKSVKLTMVFQQHTD